METLTREQAQAEYADLLKRLGSLEDARARSRAELLSDDAEVLLRRAETLSWLLGYE